MKQKVDPSLPIAYNLSLITVQSKLVPDLLSRNEKEHGFVSHFHVLYFVKKIGVGQFL